MEKQSSFINILTDRKTTQILSFLNGFLWANEGLKKTLEYPLSETAWGIFSGYVAIHGGDFVYGFSPESCKWLPNVVLTASLCANLYDKIKNYK